MISDLLNEGLNREAARLEQLAADERLKQLALQLEQQEANYRGSRCATPWAAVDVSLNASPEFAQALGELSNRLRGPPGRVLAKALVLYRMAVDARDRGD